MDFPIGTYIAIAAVLLFYLRLIILQRQKVKASQAKSARPGKKGGRAAGRPDAWSTLRPTLVIANKLFVILGVILILLGAVVSFAAGLDPALRGGWWLLVTAGILLMGLGIR